MSNNINNKENNKKINKNMSGRDWSIFLGLAIEDFRSGWSDENQYSNLLINRAEFFNRASQSKIKFPEEIKTRREAAVFLSKLNK